jgi:hypothetical protein
MNFRLNLRLNGAFCILSTRIFRGKNVAKSNIRQNGSLRLKTHLKQNVKLGRQSWAIFHNFILYSHNEQASHVVERQQYNVRVAWQEVSASRSTAQRDRFQACARASFGGHCRSGSPVTSKKNCDEVQLVHVHI